MPNKMLFAEPSFGVASVMLSRSFPPIVHRLEKRARNVRSKYEIPVLCTVSSCVVHSQPSSISYSKKITTAVRRPLSQ